MRYVTDFSGKECWKRPTHLHLLDCSHMHVIILSDNCQLPLTVSLCIILTQPTQQTAHKHGEVVGIYKWQLSGKVKNVCTRRSQKTKFACLFQMNGGKLRQAKHMVVFEHQYVATKLVMVLVIRYNETFQARVVEGDVMLFSQPLLDFSFDSVWGTKLGLYHGWGVEAKCQVSTPYTATVCLQFLSKSSPFCCIQL